MIKIAVLGMGTVGGGVADIIDGNSRSISKKLGGSGEKLIEIKYVLDRRTNVGHGCDGLVTDDIDKILNDDEVSVVVETMGGVHPAYEFTKRSLERGKSVVTSNKAVVAACGAELLGIARENGVAYLFEASVGGGIPVIRPLMNCLAANEIISIYGILNGTTNYILTEMERCGVTFEAALEDAKRLGYAEADPTADISGADTARKICILADVAFGMYITHEDICYRGIESVVPADIKCASMLGYRIKLLGAARRCENGAEVFVEPMLVPAHSPLALVDNVYNAVSVEGNAVGDIMFSGRGAGAMPTASAVVADIIDAVTCSPKYPDFDPEGGKVVPAGLDGPVFVRVKVGDEGRRFADKLGAEVVTDDDSIAFVISDASLLDGSGIVPLSVYRIRKSE